MFIATATKKAASRLGDTGACSREVWKQIKANNTRYGIIIIQSIIYSSAMHWASKTVSLLVGYKGIIILLYTKMFTTPQAITSQYIH